MSIEWIHYKEHCPETGCNGDKECHFYPIPYDRSMALHAALDDLYGAAEYENLIDALADLRHFSDVFGLDFGAADKEAYQNYLNERARNISPIKTRSFATAVSEVTP